MKVSPTIFREYDIRGIAGRTFTPEQIETYEKWYGPFPGVNLTSEVASAIGKAYGTMIRRSGGKKVIGGYEARPFAQELKEAFFDGVRSAGCKVVDTDVSLTPLIYFACAFFKFDGGVSITGSHNIYFYNGFKLMKKDVWPLFGRDLQEMRQMIEREDFIEDRQGAYEKFDVFEAYRTYFQKHLKISRPLRIVIDAGNGSAGIFAPRLFRELGCEVGELYCEPDATFPHHTPDPEAPQNMRDLSEKVIRERADLGIGFDSDGDRVGFVNEKGEFISADLILLLLAKDALRRHPRKKILYDVKCSQLLAELIPLYGGIPVMHRTGHAPIKETLRKDLDIILGGEVSGHFYTVEDYFRIDDGLFAAGKVLELFSRTKAPFSAMFREIPSRVRTPEIKLPCIDEKKFTIMEQIKRSLKEKYPSTTIDGIRIQVTKKGWGLIRASNTSPYLTIRVEGETEEEALKIKNILADELEKFPDIGDRLNRSQTAVLEGKLGWV